MACTYTLGVTAADQVRLLAVDADCTAGTYRFDDVEIQSFLNLNGQDVRLAAAQALDVLASEWANIAGRVRLDNMLIDGQVAAEALKAQAVELRRQVHEAEVDGSGLFDYAEQVVDTFTLRQRLLNELLRKSG